MNGQLHATATLSERKKLPVPIGSGLGVLLSRAASRSNNHLSSDAQPIAQLTVAQLRRECVATLKF